MGWPNTLVLPATCWCSWFFRHVWPWIARCSSSEVVQTFKRFRIGFWVAGSFRFPIRHKSKRHSVVSWRISLRTGSFSMADPSGCSRWKCCPEAFWNLNKTTARLTCHSAFCRLCNTSWHPWRDFPMLRLLHLLHGPHSGLSHTCLGRWVTKTWNNLRRPSRVERSPSDNPKRLQRPPMASACFTSSLWGAHITSRRSKRGAEYLDLETNVWTSRSSCSNLWINRRHCCP